MWKWNAYWLMLLAAISGLAIWKNRKFFPSKSWSWLLGKSLVDVGLVICLALYLPALLIAYCVIWLTRNMKDTVTKVTIAVLGGVLFTVMSTYVLEGVVVIGLFAIDLVATKFLKYWEEVK